MDDQNMDDLAPWANDFATELVAGGAIDELARAARSHGILISLSFIPAAAEDENKITKREALALGWMSTELAARTGAAAGILPDPPEWIELWEQALAHTADDRNEDEDTDD